MHHKHKYKIKSPKTSEENIREYFCNLGIDKGFSDQKKIVIGVLNIKNVCLPKDSFT